MVELLGWVDNKPKRAVWPSAKKLFLQTAITLGISSYCDGIRKRRA